MYLTLEQLCKLHGEDKKESIRDGMINGYEMARAELNETIVRALQNIFDAQK